MNDAREMDVTRAQNIERGRLLLHVLMNGCWVLTGQSRDRTQAVPVSRADINAFQKVSHGNPSGKRVVDTFALESYRVV